MHKTSSFRLVDRVTEPRKKSAAGPVNLSALPYQSSVAPGRGSALPENTHADAGGCAKTRGMLDGATTRGSALPASTPEKTGAILRRCREPFAAPGDLSALPL
jgi:hypothetical protein